MRVRQLVVPVVAGIGLVLVCPRGVSAEPRGATDPPPWSARQSLALAELQRHFAEPDLFYAPFAFWFWDAPLDPAQTAYQAGEMCRQRLNPGYAHGRYGLPVEQWLSENWFAALDESLKKAAAGGYVGFCDEYWWPSGQAGGRTIAKHPELKAVSLRWQILDVSGRQTVQLPESFFTAAAEQLDQRTIKSATLQVIGAGPAFEWTVPAGEWRVYTFTQYHHPGLDGSPVNYLDERLPGAFIELAYEPYAKHFGDRLRRMPGVFMDSEGDYGWRLAWSEHLARRYQERKGRDLRTWMPLLFERDAEGRWAKARWDWFDVLTDIYADEYFAALSRWFADRGLFFTMHIWEESLLLQGEAAGDFFRVQRAVTMPGNDCLVHKALEVHDFKEVQSVAEFEGRQFMSEVLGVAGWEMTPVLTKQAINAVTAWGVSHVIPHGVNLNRELNKIPYPPDFFTENPYWPYLHLWNDFARRACYVNAHGRYVPDVLLLYPMDSIWALADGIFDADKPNPQWGALWGPEAHRINDVYSQAIVDLAAARVEYLVADSKYVRKMEAQPRGVLKYGDFEFRAVVLPPLVVLPLDVADKLVAFAEGGGAVYALGELPAGSTDNGLNDPRMRALMDEFRAHERFVQCRDGLAAELARRQAPLAPQFEFESGEFPVLVQHRRTAPENDLFWLANNTGKRQQCRIVFHGVSEAASRWDCETGTITPLPSEAGPTGNRVELRFDPYEGYWLAFGHRDAAQPSASPVSPPSIADAEAIQVNGPWRVRLERTGQPSPAPDIAKFFTVPWNSAEWLKAGETSRFRYEFDLPAAPEQAFAWITADDSFRAWVNGQMIPRQAWDELWQQARRIDLTQLLQAGNNVVAVQVEAPPAADGEPRTAGVILAGEAKLPGGRVVKLASDRCWRLAPERVAPRPPEFGQWLWGPSTAAQQRVYFRRDFTLGESTGLRQAMLRLSVDNGYTVYLNGQKLGSGDNWKQLDSYEVGPCLVVGTNVLALEARNEDGPAGVLASLHLKPADGTVVSVLSDGDWRCADKADAGWTETRFDDSGWSKAKVVGKYGDSPWGRFEETVVEPRPDWVQSSFDASRWVAAESLGPPPVAPWVDVPPEFLAEIGVERPLESWQEWNLARFSGYVDYMTTFSLPGGAQGGGRHLILDLGRVLHLAEVWVNGQQVGARLWPPFEFDATAAVRPGTNELRVRIGNLVLNEMAQFADKGKLGTWGWRPPPTREQFDAGLLGPVTLRIAEQR